MFGSPGLPGPSFHGFSISLLPEEDVSRPVSGDEHPPCWSLIRGELRRAVPDSTWHQWLEPLSARQSEDGTLLVEAPSQLRPWVTKRYGRLLQACAAAVLGPGATMDFVTADEPREAVAHPRAPDASGPADALNPRHTFDQFVIGESNRLAHAAALAVAEMPGLAYNPLYICGPSGLGKTHLLHSIGNYVTAYGDNVAVRYTTAEAFTNHFLGSLRNKHVDAFKAAYRGVDLLLVDDVQFLQKKTRTEQEFFHTFNELHQAGAQIVLSSDRLPGDLDSLELRLRERFEAGLVTDVRAPDPLTRHVILRKRILQDDVGTVDPAVLDLIADQVVDNVRALEGALIRIVAFGSLTGRAVTADLAGEVLLGLYPDVRRRRAVITVAEIQERTAEAFGISVEALVSSSRASAFVRPRQIAMYLARQLTAQSLPAIGRAFGGRNHTTVLHACRRTAERIVDDPDAFELIRRLTDSLGAAQRPA